MMKKFFRPYGPAFIIGMVMIACCLIFATTVAVFYTDVYYTTSQKFKDQTANLWAMLFALGFLFIIVGSPTAPSKK